MIGKKLNLKFFSDRTQIKFEIIKINFSLITRLELQYAVERRRTKNPCIK